MSLATTSLWFAWNVEPIPVLGIAALAGGYAYATARHRRLTGDVNRGKIAYFATGIAFLVVALCSPLDFIGMHYLLTAHMIQHVIFSVIVPPLLLLGTPEWMVTPLLRNERVRKTLRVLTFPPMAFGLYNLNMWFWHIPAVLNVTPPGGVIQINQLLDNAALLAALLFAAFVLIPRIPRARGGAWSRPGSVVVILAVVALAATGALDVGLWPEISRPHNPVHTVMNMTFLLTATLYWCPILSPTPRLPRISPVFGMLYMFISTQPMMALGALIVLANRPIFPTYQNAPLLWGFTRLGDQQFGGLIMWLIMDIPLLLTITILFFSWVNGIERRQRLAEAAQEEDLIWRSEGATPARPHTT